MINMVSEIANSVAEIIEDDLSTEKLKNITDAEIKAYLTDYFQEICLDFCTEIIKEDIRSFIEDKEK